MWGNKRLFLLICTEKKKSGRAGKPCFDIPKLWPTTLINSPAGVRVQERTSWCWQISFRNDSGCGQIKNRKATTRFSQRGALFPFLNTGPAGGEPSVESGTARPVGRCLGGRKRRRQCEKSRQAAAVQRQRPASWRRAPSVCELLHWLYVHIKPYTSETWAAGFLSDVKLHPSWPLVNIDRVVTVTSTRGGRGLHWIMELPVFYIYNHFIGKRLNVFTI